MPQAWRIVKEKHAADAFSGAGAARTGGRWNSRGLRVVYTSATQSLAVLETLVHLNPIVLFKYVVFRIDFDARFVEQLNAAQLPRDWQAQPASPSTRLIGGAWLRAARSVLLAVPSVIVPGELNYLINPLHPDFNRITIAKPTPFAFDARLLA